MKTSQFFAYIALGLCCIVTVGCATVDKTMESWMGHSSSDLVASWGPPQQIIDANDAQRGKVYIYTSVRSYTSPGHAETHVTGSAYSTGNYVSGNATGHTTYTPPQTSSYAAQRMFWVTTDGCIYRWAWKGL